MRHHAEPAQAAGHIAVRGARTSQVLRPDELPAIDRGGGVRTVPLVTAARGGTTYLTGTTVFSPGTAIGHHMHNVAESVMVIAGNAVVDIDGTRTQLRTFDTTFVPANVPHHFENASDTDEMRILWVYGSLDATRTVLDQGERRTSRIDDEQGLSSAAGSVRPIQEIALIDVLPGHEQAFEAAVVAATPLFQEAGGSRTLALTRSHEHPRRYRMVVGWASVEDHVSGFRGSPSFAAWRDLVGEHFAGPPQVEHVRTVYIGF
jgi:quercetin dioxygenase-like cupin family protein/quinol monooxygenase YgiN